MSRGTLELPFPPRELSPNARGHWRQKAHAVAEYRQDCGWLGKLVKSPSHASEIGRYPIKPPVVADVEFVVPDRRRRDQDNLLASLKPAWDGLVDAGVLEDDSSDVFSIGRVSVRVGRPACVIVRLS